MWQLVVTHSHLQDNGEKSNKSVLFILRSESSQEWPIPDDCSEREREREEERERERKREKENGMFLKRIGVLHAVVSQSDDR
jgi:hypothetical protein